MQVLDLGSLGAMDVYTKKVRTADQAGAEAAGLRWLAEARPDVVVEVTGVSATSISTRRVVQATPTAEAARAFGRALREVHEAGAPAFGAPPAGWEGKNYIGRIEQDCTPTSEWGEFYVEQRVLPFVEGTDLPGDVADVVRWAADAVRRTQWDVSPARIHGDLWAGNVLFTADSAVMIDPAAHGGHPYTDLAMLELLERPSTTTSSAATVPGTMWRRGFRRISCIRWRCTRLPTDRCITGHWVRQRRLLWKRWGRANAPACAGPAA